MESRPATCPTGSSSQEGLGGLGAGMRRKEAAPFLGKRLRQGLCLCSPRDVLKPFEQSHPPLLTVSVCVVCAGVVWVCIRVLSVH